MGGLFARERESLKNLRDLVPFFAKKKVSHVCYTIYCVLVGGCSLPHTRCVLLVCVLHIKILPKRFPSHKNEIQYIANSNGICCFLFPGKLNNTLQVSCC